jgi:tripartite-type tricarboxylate transporter receptor subunit TctC
MRIAAVLAATVLASTVAFAQSYPGKPIKIVVPFSAGGGVDNLTRLIAKPLSERLKQPVVIDNRPGGNANIGAEVAAKSPPDGYTLLMTSSVSTANRALFKNLSYDALTDFVQIVRIASAPSILVVATSLPVNSVVQLVAYGKANAANVSFASTGVGSGQHLNGEIFSKYAGVPAVHVPYKGGPPAITDLMTGRITFMITNPSEVLPQIEGGKLRPLAVTGSARMKALPDVPTLIEAGLKNPGNTAWWGLVAPAKTPKEIVDRIAREVLEILKDPAVRASMERMGLQDASMPPAEFAGFYREEVKRYGDLVREFKIETE